MATTSGIRWLHNAWLNEEDPNMSRLLFVLLAPAYWTTDECTRKDSLCFNDICLLRSLATSCVHELHTAAPLPPTGSNVTLKLAKYRSVVVGKKQLTPRVTHDYINISLFGSTFSRVGCNPLCNYLHFFFFFHSAYLRNRKIDDNTLHLKKI